MLGYVNRDSLNHSIADGTVWFYSRSRQKLWQKGESSQNYMNLKNILVDCDQDTFLFQVEPEGVACHTGNTTCFFTPLDKDGLEYQNQNRGSGILEDLFAVIQDRKENPSESSYTAKLIGEGVSKVAQKVVEEAGESALAAAVGNTDDLPGEVADLMYHTLVLLSVSGITPEAVWTELRKRRKERP
jgi:phosphoribosyl-ATP pyrophosphohydrolase/phosphoribosyl-AMP cyclohydrolase